MKKNVIALVVIAALGAAVFALTKSERHYIRPVITDAEQHNSQMNACVKSALERHPGAVIEVELEKEDGKLSFDIDIQGKDGKNWEIECDAASGQITEDGEERG